MNMWFSSDEKKQLSTRHSIANVQIIWIKELKFPLDIFYQVKIVYPVNLSISWKNLSSLFL
jgi:hypothetical protein